jgi:hypothetical protein
MSTQTLLPSTGGFEVDDHMSMTGHLSGRGERCGGEVGMPARVEESVQEPKHALKRRGAADSEVSGEVKNVLRQRMYDPASALQFNSSMNMDDKKDINWRMPGPEKVVLNVDKIRRQVIGVDGVRWTSRRIALTTDSICFGLDPSMSVCMHIYPSRIHARQKMLGI